MSVKSVERELAPRGKIEFRRDLHAKRLSERGDVLLTRKNIYYLGPWTRKMAEIATGRKELKFNALLSVLRGSELDAEKLLQIFPLTRAYNRLAEMSYERKK